MKSLKPALFFVALALVSANLNAQTWSTVGSGVANGSPSTAVNDVCPDNGNGFYVVGSFETAGGITCNNVAQWDGTAWQALGLGTNGTVYCVVRDGYGGIYIGGNFTFAGGVACNNIAHWTGSAWEPVGIGTDGTVYAMCLGGGYNLLYIGGRFESANGTICNNIASYDPSNGTWGYFGSGMQLNNTANAYVYAFCIAGDYLLVGGAFDSAGGTPCNNIAFLLMWSGLFSDIGGINGNVYAIEYNPDNYDVYLSGNFSLANGGTVLCNKVACLNAASFSWSALGEGMVGTDVTCLKYHAASTSLFAGGSFNTAGGVTCSNISRWNGSVWEALGSGANAPVDALTMNTNTLIAGGTFTTAGGLDASRIASCDVTAFEVTFVAGTGGSVAGTNPQVVLSGGNCTPVTAVPLGGYAFSNWTSDTGGTSTDQTMTVTNVQSVQTWTANFVPSTTYTVDFFTSTGGQIFGTTSQTVNAGDDCTEVTAVPDTGYQFVNWTSSLGGTLATAAITITNVTQDQTWTANFTASGGTANIFVGAVITVPATSVGITGSFNRKPGVRGTYVCPISLTPGQRSNTTIVNSFPNANAIAKWEKSIKLYNKRLVTHPISAWIVANLPADLGLTTIEVKSKQTVPANTWVVAAGVSATYRNPNPALITGTETAGTQVTINGLYFGEKAPKILVEYQTATGVWKYKSCKITRASTYLYQNAKGQAGKSCTKILAADPATGSVGDSVVVFVYPSLPAGVAPSHYVIIDNGSGLNSISF